MVFHWMSIVSQFFISFYLAEKSADAKYFNQTSSFFVFVYELLEICCLFLVMWSLAKFKQDETTASNGHIEQAGFIDKPPSYEEVMNLNKSLV